MGILTDIMQAGERFKRNLRAAPGQLSDQLGNYAEDWKALATGTRATLASKQGSSDSASFIRKRAEEIALDTIAPASGSVGLAGTFIGNKAAGVWDAARAREFYNLSFAGKDADTIWKKVQTFAAKDGKLRQEIDDSGAFLTHEYGDAVGSYAGNATLDDYLIHPELKKAYPDIFNYPIRVRDHPTTLGSFNSASKLITIPPVSRDGAQATLSTLMHEVQHAVQTKEGFAPGGMPSEFMPSQSDYRLLDSIEARIKGIAAVKSGKVSGLVIEDPITKQTIDLKDSSTDYLYKMFAKLAAERKEVAKRVNVDAYKSYRSLLGEAEARATQDRLGYTPESRRLLPPSTFYDIPESELIIKEPYYSTASTDELRAKLLGSQK